jgi:hypothetical protein
MLLQDLASITLIARIMKFMLFRLLLKFQGNLHQKEYGIFLRSSLYLQSRSGIGFGFLEAGGTKKPKTQYEKA